LDKEATTSYNDIFDAFRLILKLYCSQDSRLQAVRCYFITPRGKDI
jgi:hypothetical protein